MGYIELSPAYTGHPIYTGYMIGLLGFAAAIMAARTDSLTTTEKFVWIILCGCLLILEIDTIDADHADQEKVHNSDVTAQSAQFGEILINNRRIITQQQKGFEKTLKTQQDGFVKTLSEINTAHKEDEKEFLGVLDRQNESLEEQRELSEQFTGRLVPGNDPTPKNACSHAIAPKKGEVMIIAGDSADITGSFPHTILMVGRFSVLSVDRVENSSNLAISVDMRDQLNRVAFRIDKNGIVNRSQFIALRPDKSTLLLQDEYGNEIFRARYRNPQVFEVNGQVAYCGQLLRLQPPGLCLSYNNVDLHLPGDSCPTQPK